MALNTYSALKAGIKTYLVGFFDDATEAVIGDFIAVAEADMFRNLRLRHGIARATALVTDGYVALPSDCVQVERVTLLGNPDRPLDPVTLDFAGRAPATGAPGYYCVTGTEVEIVPAPTGEGAQIELVYYRRPLPLSDETPTNWLLDLSPDLYLYATLAAAAHWIADPQRGALWRAEAERIKAELETDTTRASVGGSPLVMRPRRSIR
jgi:hypothetical protein